MYRRVTIRSRQENRLFRRILISYSLFIIVLVPAVSFFSSVKNAQDLRDEILHTRMEQLRRFRLQFDRLLPDWVNQQLSNAFVVDNNDMRKLTAWEHNASLQSLREASVEMTKIVMSNPYLRDISFYSRETDTFLSSLYGLNLGMTEHRPHPVYSAYAPFFEELAESSPSDSGWMRWASRGEEQRIIPLLTFYQFLPFGARGGRRSWIAYHFDLNSLNSIVKAELTDDSEFFIYYNQRSLFGPAAFPESRLMPSAPSGILFTDEKAVRNAVLWVRSRSSSLVYLYEVPLNHLYQQVTASIWIAAAVTILILLFALIAMGFITSHYFRPLGSLFQTLRNRAGRDGTKLNLHSAQRYLKTMEESIENTREISRHNLFLAILLGRLNGEKSFSERQQAAGISFDEGKAGIIVIKIEPTVFRELPIDVQEWTALEVKKKIHGFFEGKSAQCLAYSHRGSAIPVLFSPVSLTNNELDRLLQELGECVPLNICVGGCSIALEDVHRAFERCREYSSYSFLYPSGKIFDETLISQWEDKHIEFHTREMNQIKRLIKSSGSDAYFKSFEDSLRGYCEEGVSLISLKNYLLQNALLLGELASERGMETPRLDCSHLEVESMEQESLKLWTEWFRSRLSIYRSARQKQFKISRSQFIDSVKDYIEGNIDSQISLDTVAHYFEISPSHLCRLFKEYSDLSFGDYLKHSKMKLAAHILRRSSEEGIARIAAGLGYQTPSYFSRIFKEFYGMTPGRYRKHYRRGIGSDVSSASIPDGLN